MTEKLNSEYWENRYKRSQTAWDAGSITMPLKTYFDQLADKKLRILIPGAGNAYEAEYLFDSGFTNTFVCDLALQPLQNLKSRCPRIPETHLIQKDFFELDGTYDLIVEQTFFCALDPNLRQAYFDKMFSLLAPGGKLVGLLFNEPLNSEFPPFGGSAEEYEKYFRSKFKVRTFETSYNSIKPRSGRELFMILEKPAVR